MRGLCPVYALDPLALDAKKVRAFFETQKVWSASNSVGMCDFVGTPLNGLELQPMVDYINAAARFLELPEPAERERRGGRGQLLDYSDTSSLAVWRTRRERSCRPGSRHAARGVGSRHSRGRDPPSLD